MFIHINTIIVDSDDISHIAKTYDTDTDLYIIQVTTKMGEKLETAFHVKETYEDSYDAIMRQLKNEKTPLITKKRSCCIIV
jgi:hypothetical protein